MKRRFEVTLLAVAIASLSTLAFCRAPVISEFRSPVIADDKPVTGSNIFVYPDALNLDQIGNDPDNTVTPGNIIWSYTGNGSYRINDRDPLNLSNPSDSPNTPLTKAVGGAGLDDPATDQAQDSNVRTITFRDNTLSPVANPAGSGSHSAGLIRSAPVTLFASDGTSYSSKTFMVYTQKGGVDHLSGGIVPTPVQALIIPQASQGWTQTAAIPGIALPTFTSGAVNGLCLASPLTNGGFGGWVSPYGILPLVQNAAYRIRLNVGTGSAAAIAQSVTPLWDLVLDNVSGVSGAVDQRYNCDFLFWDNNGAADSAGLAAGTGRHQFDCWWTPLPVLLSDWNDVSTGEFTATQDPVNDARLQFRFLDVDNSAVDGQNDAGTLCLTSYQIDRVPVTDLTSVSSLMNTTTFSAADHSLFTLAGFESLSQVTYSGGKPTISPTNTTTAWDVAVDTYDLGDGTINYGNLPTITDNWPIPWVSNQLLKFTAGIQAANSTAQTNPPDAIELGMDTASTEVLAQSLLIFSTSSVGGPKSSAAGDYVMMFYTQNKTVSAVPQYPFLRTRVGVLCNTQLNTGGSAHNAGGITITHENLDLVDSNF